MILFLVFKIPLSPFLCDYQLSSSLNMQCQVFEKVLSKKNR